VEDSVRGIQRVETDDPERDWLCTYEFSLVIHGRQTHLETARGFYERMLRMVSHEDDVVLRLSAAIPDGARSPSSSPIPEQEKQ
jgi:hypothetical protein